MRIMTGRRLFATATLVPFAAITFLAAAAPIEQPSATGGALDGHRHRVLVSTDIGGTDPDDFQSLVHLLLYADVLDLEGLISSPFGPGRLAHIIEVLDRYALDYPRLRAVSSVYPTPESIRAISTQGETEVAPYAGVRRATDGSAWIIRCARRPDPRPLHVLVWGGLEDLAQALHDAPDILPKLRVHWVGGPNKKWSPDAYHYIASHHPTLWFIESNSTYRGWFVGGRQDGEWGNESFVRTHIAGRGALGHYFASHLGAVIKMGDSPTVGWLLRGTPHAPDRPGWGGRFVRAWDRFELVHERLTTRDDRMEQFGILELRLPLGPAAPAAPDGRMVVENQELRGHAQDGTLRFRFCPRDAKTFRYTIRSNVQSLDGQSGEITAVAPSPSSADHPSARFPNWWTDDPSPAAAEGLHQGARSVNQWRDTFLRDFARRMERAAGRP
ncbi:MAG: DUF1593 domain-containing protein [Vicinamibacterales bacterium]|nr:DUF1593 domain-containing protein [Vicinamibacterales bacterium]